MERSGISRNLVCLLVLAVPTGLAFGHGSLSHPPSRIYSAFQEGPEQPVSDAVIDAIAIGGTQPLYDWNELVNFHPGTSDQQRVIDYSQTIPDGQLASAGNAKYAGFDQVRSDWPSTELQPGPFEFVWYATTPHDPSVHRAWITTEDWDPNMPLDWAHMEALSIGPVSLEDSAYRFNAILPHRTGKHVIYVIWQRLDPVGEGFYAVADVDFGQSVDPTEGPADFDDDGQITEAHSISAGLDYPGIGPLHAHLIETGRAKAVHVRDEEAIGAVHQLSRLEGIIPALETAHALAALKYLDLKPHQVVVVNLSGRGDKDLDQILSYKL